MMRGITIWLITCMLYTAQAQNTSGITGIHDTTFTLQNEWTKHIKSYPFIKFPTVVVNKDLIHANDIVYCNLGSRGLKLDLIYGLNTHVHADHITGTNGLKSVSLLRSTV